MYLSSRYAHLQNTASLHQNDALRKDLLDQDSDPFDDFLRDCEGGVLVRTDFSDEEAWSAFYSRYQDAERDFKESVLINKEEPSGGSDLLEVQMDVDNQTADEDSDTDTESGAGTLIKVLNPSTPHGRTILQGISNLCALRLLNDADIRPAPSPQAGQRRLSHPNRIIDQNGWQEVYPGLTVWIYDYQSNQDGCVKLVSNEGDVYGTAT
jgi:hypothetical protein